MGSGGPAGTADQVDSARGSELRGTRRARVLASIEAIRD